MESKLFETEGKNAPQKLLYKQSSTEFPTSLLELDLTRSKKLCVTWKEPSKEIAKSRLFVRSIDIDQVISCANIKYLEQTNRMFDRYGSDNFIIFDFSKKVEGATVRKILWNGVIINKDEYQFIGCSSNGLKERTCYMFRGTCNDVSRIWKECGSFSSIKSRYKRLKRIGLLFSSAMPTQIEIPDDHVVEVEDIVSDGGNFTDGCGAINMVLADKLRALYKLADDYNPSVYQIRYQGCKGVVIVDHSLGAAEQLVIRPSMKKFNPGTEPLRELWLCDRSRPYSFGHLNRQFITLFSSLGVNDDFFLRIQREHFTRLENILQDPKAAFEMLLLDNQPELASSITGVESLHKFKSHLAKIKAKYVSKLEKLRLPVLKSRNVFGVCDPASKLKYGQCYFCFTEQGKSKTLTGSVVVAKNPCYLLGDVRVLSAVDVTGLDSLIDCIVFPTQGERPHPSEIAGSDLDGDQYFVCWEEDLIILHAHKPYHYPSADIPEISNEVTFYSLIDYFSSQRNNMGKIDTYYKYWANKKGAHCSECVSLGKLFSRSVDATKTGDVVSIPSNLKPPLEATTNEDDSLLSKETGGYVWIEMEKRAKAEKQALSEDIVRRADERSMSEDFVWNLISQKLPNISESQLLHFIHKWCYNNQQAFPDSEANMKLLEFARHINFGEFTIDQQVQAVDLGIPLKTVTNALNTSTHLPESLLQRFLLDDCFHNWRYYFSSTSANFKWKYLLRCLLRHPESLIIIKLQDVTFVLHFLFQPQLGETDIASGSVVAYFSSSHFKLALQCVLGSGFKLNLNEDTLQLFREKRTATFIKFWLSSEQLARKQGKPRSIPDTLFDRISVDLTRFKANVLRDCHPTVNKQNFLHIEMFVKTKHCEPAYMDITEADIQLGPGYQIEDATMTTDIEDLPTDPEDEDMSLETPVVYSRHATLVVLNKSSQVGNFVIFQECLELILSSECKDSCELVNAFLQLLTVMIKKYCHKLLSAEAVSCLQTIITALYPYVNTPLQLLKLISLTVQLSICSKVEQVVDHILPNICATSSLEYISVLREWKLWYFLPPTFSVRLSHHFYTLFTSLCGQSSQDRNICTANIVSDSKCDMLKIATNLRTTAPLLQHQIDEYVTHFAHLVFKQLLCDMFSLQKLVNEVHDTSSSLVKLTCYKPNHSHSSPFEGDGDVSKDSCRFGFSRAMKDIFANNFTIGSYVAISIMKKQEAMLKVACIPVAIGRIVSATKHPADIIIDVFEPVPMCLEQSAQHNQGHWQLALVGNVTLFERVLKALKLLRDVPSCTALLPLLVNSLLDDLGTLKSTQTVSSPTEKINSCVTTDPILVDTPIHFKPLTPLNSSQEKAVCSSLEQRLTLIHGPPGTGKTHVACEIVQQQLCRDKHNTILVLAETNLAVDNLCEQLKFLGVHVVRIGKLDHIVSNVQSISLEGQIERKRVQEGKDKHKSPFPDKKMSRVILDAAQVIATTCASAGDPSLKEMKFPFVIIDEATQVTEPTLLIPIVKGCQQLILIGDPEQLAPNLPLAPKHLGSYLQLDKLSETLFHRLQKSTPSIFLNEQHRMHPEIAAFPSQKFYDGKMVTAKSRYQQQTVFQEEIPIFNQSKPIVFIDVSETERHIGTSYYNLAEAVEVARITTYLIDHKVSIQQMAIITPYSGQVKRILEECDKQNIHHSKPHTIDSFQGKEADVIIFSTVRCNSRGELGFISDKYRMNVLLTRAKHGIIGIGCKKTLSKGSHLWKEWLESVNVIPANDGYITTHDKKFKKSRLSSVHRADQLKACQEKQLGARPQANRATSSKQTSKHHSFQRAHSDRSTERFSPGRGHVVKTYKTCDDQSRRISHGIRGHRRGGIGQLARPRTLPGKQRRDLMKDTDEGGLHSEDESKSVPKDGLSLTTGYGPGKDENR